MDNNSSSGVGLFGLVFIVFLVLKLAEVGAVADWSWWWVTAPLWGPALLALLLVVVGGLGWALAASGIWLWDRARRR